MNSLRSGLRRTGGHAWAFVSAPRSPQPLAVFRIGVALLLLIQAWTLSSHLTLLFGDRGLTPWSVTEPLASPWVPRLAAIVQLVAGWGVSATACLQVLASLYALSLVGLLLGWHTRVCAVAAWVGHAVLLNSGVLFSYGLETFAHISLFYCVVMPVGTAFSLDVRAGRVSAAPSPGATLSLRVLQLHLCAVYFLTGVEKAAGAPWQQGTAIWQILMQPQYSNFDFSWMAYHPWVSKLVTWGTLVIEVGYPLFVWPRRTRAAWVLLTVGMHAGIALFMGLWLFSGIMAVLTFAAFGWEPLASAVGAYGRGTDSMRSASRAKRAMRSMSGAMNSRG